MKAFMAFNCRKQSKLFNFGIWEEKFDLFYIPLRGRLKTSGEDAILSKYTLQGTSISLVKFNQQNDFNFLFFMSS